MGEARDTAALRGELARLVGAEHVLGEGDFAAGGFAATCRTRLRARGLRGRAIWW
jgi:hypothetical protein